MGNSNFIASWSQVREMTRDVWLVSLTRTVLGDGAHTL